MSNPVADSYQTRFVASGSEAKEAPFASILVNPHSFRISDGQRLDQICRTAQDAGIPVHVVHGPAEIELAVAACLTRKSERLVLIGGDGTVQAAVSALTRAPAASIPPLLVLGGGRTNFTARDLGTHQSPVQLLRRVLQQPHDLNTEHRRVLTLTQRGADLILHGFFIAGALVDYVIRDCHCYRTRHQGWLRTGHPSSAWRVAQLALMSALGRSRYRPAPMAVDAAGLGEMEQPLRILTATSLEHTRGWIDPYAARGSGAVRLTAISASAARFWRTLPGLLRGRLSPALQEATGYLSGRTETVNIRGLAAVCIDGQEYDLDPNLDVVIRAGTEFRFLTP